MAGRVVARTSRVCALAAWMWLVWTLLTWTATVEQVAYGGGFAVALAWPLSTLGSVVPPWRALDPRRLVALVAGAAVYLWRLVGANVSLARRIWLPSRPLRSGMVVVPDPSRSPRARAAVGLITSTVVDNQLVDVADADRRTMQFHAVWVASVDDEAANAVAIFGSLPRWVERTRSGRWR